MAMLYLHEDDADIREVLVVIDDFTMAYETRTFCNMMFYNPDDCHDLGIARKLEQKSTSTTIVLRTFQRTL